MIDLHPAAHRLAAVVTAITDDALTGPTPCPEYTVGDLVEHVAGLSLAFRAAATKAPVDGAPAAAAGDAYRLAPDWRTPKPQDLAALADAWTDPGAWSGMTAVGGVTLPGEVCGVVALDELVIHGWDLATATGQAFTAPDDELRAVEGFALQFSQPGQEEARQGLFGPVVHAPGGAPYFDKVLGLTGRDPHWSATS
jgi:uncharacterized protein (TIGR03086 family)